MGFKAVLTASLVALLAGCGKDPMKNRPVQTRNLNALSTPEGEAKMFSATGYALNLIPSETGKGYNGIELKVSPERLQLANSYDSVICEVPHANYVSRNLKGVSIEKLLFKEAVSLEDALVSFYGVQDGKKTAIAEIRLNAKEGDHGK